MLITPAYLTEQRWLHERGGYGANSDKWAPLVAALTLACRAHSILDYGCGQGRLVYALRKVFTPAVQVYGYDPAIDRFACWLEPLPPRCDLTICTDVLEHIEPDLLKSVLGHLAHVTRKWLFVAIATRPSTKVLSDGRNAHLIVQSAEWWQRKLASHSWIHVPCPVPIHPYDPALEWAGLFTPPKVS